MSWPEGSLFLQLLTVSSRPCIIYLSASPTQKQRHTPSPPVLASWPPGFSLLPPDHHCHNFTMTSSSNQAVCKYLNLFSKRQGAMQMKRNSKLPPPQAMEIPGEFWVHPGAGGVAPEMALSLEQFSPVSYFKNSGNVISAERSFLCAI